MGINIMDNTSRMMCLKSRYGLGVAISCSATSKYIEEVKIRKQAVKYWSEMKEDFIKKFRFHKGFCYQTAENLNANLKGLMEKKLYRLRDQMEERGPQAVWDFVYKRMNLKEDVVRNFGQFDEKN